MLLRTGFVPNAKWQLTRSAVTSVVILVIVIAVVSDVLSHILGWIKKSASNGPLKTK